MTIDDPMMSLNGELQEIDPGRKTSPLIKDGRTLVPIRAIIEAMGGSVGWDPGQGKVSLNAFGHDIAMWIDSKAIQVDGAANSMDVPPQIINERTMLPVRFVVENVGCQIVWIASTREIVIVFATP